MKTGIQALVLTGFGLNCDHETAHALTLAGAQARRVHINALIAGEVDLNAFQLLVFGGGFSWGDDHGAGVVQAVRLQSHVGDRLMRFIDQQNLIIGICNGFQTLVNMGLLPGFDGDYNSRQVALVHNDCGNFRDQWVDLCVDSASPCVFTRGLPHLQLPVRHGEGKLIASSDVIDRLVDDHQVVMRYADAQGQPAGGQFPQNPNGSIHDIAGICDPTGRIFGLMPHPEAFNHYTNHPDWTWEREKLRRKRRDICSDGQTVGVQMFRNAISWVEE